MTSNPSKTVDCIKLKQAGQEALRVRLATMTPEQQLAFWAQQAQALRATQQSVQASAVQPPTPQRRAG
jgi:hypothetical protein